MDILSFEVSVYSGFGFGFGPDGLLGDELHVEKPTNKPTTPNTR